MKVTEVDIDRKLHQIRSLFGPSPEKGKWRPAKNFDEPWCSHCGLPLNNCVCGDEFDDDRPY
jgi:hypothetical protein